MYSILDEDIPNIFIADENVAMDMWRQEDKEKIKAAIFSLPEKYREILTLRYIEDKSYEEIMDIVELPKGTVAARINRAKKMILQNISPTNLFHSI